MKNNSEIKTFLYEQCRLFLDARLKNVQHNITEIQEALNAETKSTAGDKHETGRAMLQLEREKLGLQLAEINRVIQNFSKINISKSSHTVCLGSVVFTSRSNYFIAVSAGEYEVEGHKFYAIAPNTPIGQLLLSKQVGDVVMFRNQEFTISELI